MQKSEYLNLLRFRSTPPSRPHPPSWSCSSGAIILCWKLALFILASEFSCFFTASRRSQTASLTHFVSKGVSFGSATHFTGHKDKALFIIQVYLRTNLSLTNSRTRALTHTHTPYLACILLDCGGLKGSTIAAGSSR